MMPALRPAHSRALAAAAICLVALGSSACFLAGHPASAPSAGEVSALEAQAAAHPADTQTALRLAAAYRAASRLDDARVLLERTVANAPRNDAAVLLLGLAYEDLGRFADARALYEKQSGAGSTGTMRKRVQGRLALVRRQEMVAAAREALARESALADAPPAPGTVAVLPFDFAAADSTLRPLGRALADMLTTDLSQTDRLTVLERSRVQALLDEMALARSGLVDAPTAVRSGRMLGTGQVVQGRISGGGSQALRLDAQLVRVNADAAPLPVSSETDVRQVLDAEKAVALGLYEQMGVRLTPAERERVSRRPTENLQALLAFGQALEREDAGDFAGAAAFYRRAAALDPAFGAARQKAAGSEAAAGAASTTTTVLAGALTLEVTMPASLPGLAIEDVAPLPVARDPASEGLGREQVGKTRSGIEIIVKRP
jgi:tetratricopeptide (TPR) repeat protein